MYSQDFLRCVVVHTNCVSAYCDLCSKNSRPSSFDKLGIQNVSKWYSTSVSVMFQLFQIQSIVDKIGYPQYILDNDSVDRIYQSVSQLTT